MNKSQAPNDENSVSETYEIRIEGHLQDRWADWFENTILTREDDGSTKLLTSLPDQTALHSVLLKIRDLNLKIISVTEITNMSDFELQNQDRKEK